jgi:hypothetical protein
MRAHPFVGTSPIEIETRIREAATSAAGAPVVVHVAEEAWGLINVGVSLPRTRRTRLASRNLRMTVARALEAVGVSLWPAAIAPRASGELRGSVRVREIEGPRVVDAASFAAPPPSRAGLA